MILDSSAIVAVLRAEPEAPEFTEAITSAAKCRVSAVSYVEAAIVIDSSKDAIASRRFDDFFRVSGIVVETVTPRQAEIARHAMATTTNMAWELAVARTKRNAAPVRGNNRLIIAQSCRATYRTESRKGRVRRRLFPI